MRTLSTSSLNSLSIYDTAVLTIVVCSTSSLNNVLVCDTAVLTIVKLYRASLILTYLKSESLSFLTHHPPIPPSTQPTPNLTPFSVLGILFLYFLISYANETMQHLPFLVGGVSLSTMPSSFIHVTMASL